jgi:signal transduction histidine kinase
MSLKKIHSLWHSLAFRLALYYAGILMASCCTAFVVFHVIVSSVIQSNRDRMLMGDLTELMASLNKTQGIQEFKDAVDAETASDGVQNIVIRLFSENGKEIFSSDMSSWGSIGISPQARRQLKKGSVNFLENRNVPGREYKARFIYGLTGRGQILQIGASMEQDEKFLILFWAAFGILISLVIPFATFSGWLIGKRALMGVEQVTKTALNISRGDLGQRVSVGSGAEEITRLAGTFNTMLDRIDTLVAGIRNMTDDIAHDLKKPIARIRVISERNISTNHNTNRDDQVYARIIEECDNLMQMIDTMLDVSEAEAGAAPLDMKQIDIAGIVRNAHDLFYPLAEDKGLRFVLDIPVMCLVLGDIHKSQRMIANLLDNAFKYTLPGGEVEISMKEDRDKVMISIRDTGIGISADDLPHIFERFFRCDKSRSEAGIGLGLTLAKAIAGSHGGDITVQSSPGIGSTFTVILPALIS